MTIPYKYQNKDWHTDDTDFNRLKRIFFNIIKTSQSVQIRLIRVVCVLLFLNLVRLADSHYRL